MSWTKRQIAERTRLPERLVAYYTDRGVVEPSVDSGQGRGRVRRYSQDNLFDFAIIRELSVYGMSFPVVESIMACLRGASPLTETVRSYLKEEPGRDSVLYVVPSDGAFDIYSSKNIGDVTKIQLGQAESCLILSLKNIAARVL